MEHIDLAELKRDTRSTRPCEFCRELDPHFYKRRPMDHIVGGRRKATPAAHLTEDGYVRHRIAELSRLTAHVPLNAA